MLERDGYLPGVPCWVDTSQPDPEAAATFYGGLFGWELRGRDARRSRPASTSSPASAAATSPPSARSPRVDRRMAVWNTYMCGRERRRDRRQGARGRRTRLTRAVRRHGRRPDGGARRSRGRRFCVWEAERAPGRPDRQRARLGELQRPQHPRPRRARRPSTARCSAGRRSSSAAASRCGRCRATATSSSTATPACASGWPRAVRPTGFEDVVAALNADRRRAGRRPRALERDLRASTMPTPRPSGRAELGGTVLVPPFDAPWVRMTVIADPQGATFTASRFVPENRHLVDAALAPTGQTHEAR